MAAPLPLSTVRRKHSNDQLDAEYVVACYRALSTSDKLAVLNALTEADQPHNHCINAWLDRNAPIAIEYLDRTKEI